MNRATPVQMRKSLEIVQLFKGVGIQFVPMPVLNKDDHEKLVTEMQSRLAEIEKEAT